MEALLKEIDKKQIEERELLLSILQDPCLEDLREAALLMEEMDRPQRLLELQRKRKRMDLEHEGGYLETDREVSVWSSSAN